MSHWPVKRRLAAVGLLVLIGGVIGLALFKAGADHAYYDGYDAGAPLNAVTRDEVQADTYTRVSFLFDGLPGEPVPGVMAVPLAASGVPCVIFLHGIGQDKEFIDDIAGPFVDAGYALVTFDQYTRGERKLEEAGWFGQALGLRRRAALTVIETRRLVDYLVSREEIDADRIYLVGGSFGAITGSTAAAFEPRIRAAVLTYGGGDLPKLFASREAKASLGRLHGFVAALTSYVMAPADPVLHVAGIAPRPVLIQNGEHDGLIPNDAARALQEAAQEPKDIVWYDSDHVGLDEAHVRRVLDDAIAWIDKH